MWFYVTAVLVVGLCWFGNDVIGDPELFYRVYCNSSNHYYTTSVRDKHNLLFGNNSCWSSEGNVGYIYSTNIDGTTGLYHFYDSGTDNDFYTTSYANGAGFEEDLGIVGYIGTSSTSISSDDCFETKALLRYYNDVIQNHYYTLDSSTLPNNDYTLEGTEGYVCLNIGGYWWEGEYSCVLNGTHLFTIEDSSDLTNFINKCGNNYCWTGFTKYYSTDNKWYWLKNGSPYNSSNGNDEKLFEILTGFNVNSSRSLAGESYESCVVYNGGSSSFEFADCNNLTLNYKFICDDTYTDEYADARRRFVTLPYKANWFNAQKFCV